MEVVSEVVEGVALFILKSVSDVTVTVFSVSTPAYTEPKLILLGSVVINSVISPEMVSL